MRSLSSAWASCLPYLSDRRRLANYADWLVVAIAVSLPWSTSATAILVGLWLVVLPFVLDRASLALEIKSPSGALPLVIFLLAVLGTLWADVSWSQRLDGLRYFIRLLAIPLLLAQFRGSANGTKVFVGLIISCVALLFASFVSYFWPAMTWPWRSHGVGIPVKDYIVQSGEFAFCAFALLPIAISKLHARQKVRAVGLIVLIILFIGNIFYVATARTTLVVMAAFIVLFGIFKSNAKRSFHITLAAFLAVSTIGVLSSPYLRDRVSSLFKEIEHYDPTKSSPESAAQRLELWTKSLDFVAQAPIIGHGTGTIGELFRRSSVEQTGLPALMTRNPHNQTLAVSIQLGLIGVALLYSMWIAHFLLFREGQDLAAWIGLLVVVQNVVGSLFNSHLFDFTQGWLYIFGVGVAGGMTNCGKAKETAPLGTRQ